MIKNFQDDTKIIKKIINFNNAIRFKENINKKSIILVEFTTNKSIQASFSIFLRNLQRFSKSHIISYNSDLNISKSLKFKKFFTSIIRNFNYKIFESFGVSEFIYVQKKIEFIIKTDNLLKKKKFKITSKKKLLNLKINNVWIGDLIYDSYLAKHSLPTVDFESKNFILFYKEFIIGFFFWEEFFKKNKVQSVIGSHSVYQTALPMRIAIKKKINVYQVNFHNLFKLSEKNYFAYDLFDDYKKIFSNFKKSYQIKAIKYAKKRCKKRFDGKVGVDMHYSNKSAYNKLTETSRVLSENKKKKILIAAHCFLDNPHPYGINSLFEDFYEWLEFLGKFSKQTDYEWYIKTHPDFKPQTQKIINSFISKYENFKLLPSNTSHHQIIKEGINCVLTVHGTIAWEYAFFKIPVINASLNNPHINFNFSYHARNITQYKNAILNFEHLKLNFSKNEIYKFYFMHYIYRNSDWMIEDIDKFLLEIKGYKNISNLIFYKNFIKKIDKSRIKKIDDKIYKFLKSGKFLIPRNI